MVSASCEIAKLVMKVEEFRHPFMQSLSAITIGRPCVLTLPKPPGSVGWPIFLKES
jgi:hypothetical protein